VVDEPGAPSTAKDSLSVVIPSPAAVSVTLELGSLNLSSMLSSTPATKAGVSSGSVVSVLLADSLTLPVKSATATPPALSALTFTLTGRLAVASISLPPPAASILNCVTGPFLRFSSPTFTATFWKSPTPLRRFSSVCPVSADRLLVKYWTHRSSI
jgi:hypothetical protein